MHVRWVAQTLCWFSKAAILSAFMLGGHRISDLRWLSLKADPNKPVALPSQRRPLHLASVTAVASTSIIPAATSMRALTLLLEAGAEVNARDSAGLTALV